MPRYWIQLQGSGIEVPGHDYGDPEVTIRGFFVNRVVNAISLAEAAERALATVREEWASGPLSRYKAMPTLVVSHSEQLGFWRRLTARNSGYVFHPDA